MNRAAAYPYSTLAQRGARILAWLFVLGVIVLFLVAVAQFYMSGLAVLSSLLPNSHWRVEGLLAALAEIGWTPELYILYYLGFTVFGAFWSALVALLILWRRGDTWFGLLLAVELVAIGVTTNPVFSSMPIPGLLGGSLGWILWPGFFICFYLFPDGRFVPLAARWLAVLWGLFSLAGYWINQSATANEIPPLIFVALFCLIVTAFLSQVYRYFRASDALQKQQTKVVVFAVLLMAVVVPIQLIVNQLYGNNVFGIGVLQWNLINTALGGGLWSLFPISIGVAMLRYHLWDIDVLIRKTLTYATVVALLAAIYFGSVILLQAIFAAVSGQRSEVITVLSTLAIAALFVPLRNRIQNIIDKRFYRQKYDAQKVLQQFAESVRDETDLEKLTGDLVGIVNETMQPRSVSVWLQAASSPGKK